VEPVVDDEISFNFEDGYIICSKCNGKGRLFSGICPKCWGKKKLDWIENVVGVQEPQFESGRSSSSCSSSNSLTPSFPPIPSSQYFRKMKGTTNVNNNKFRGGTIQRFHKMFNKLKRRM
jgi:hypothetical protein